MRASQVKSSLADILPTFQEDYPVQLLSFIDSLYNLSLQKKPVLPNRSEIARYHICAYLAIEKYQDMLDLPNPDVQKIPAQPKIVDRLLSDFRTNLLNEIRSTSSTPHGTPRHSQTSPSKNSRYSTPLSTPTKLQGISPLKINTMEQSKVKVSSPLKRLQMLKSEDEGQSKKRKISHAIKDDNSPFNPKTESSPSVGATIYKYDKKHITIPDFISFANNFYIPSEITPKMVQTFIEHKHKFSKKSEWLLACGMVHAAYIRINHALLHKRIGAKTQFQNQLFQYQKGGLMRWNMLLWCNIIEDSVKDEPWIFEIEQKYIYDYEELGDEKKMKEFQAKVGNGWELLHGFGSMITGSHILESDDQTKYYNEWTSRINTEFSK